MRGIGIFVTLLIAAIVGVGAYQLGVAQGLATTGTAVAPAVYYHPYFFGGFGFLFPLLFLFLIFFLIRGAFWGGGWGRRYGGGPGGGYWGDPRSRLEEWHKEMHGEKPQGGGSTSPTPPSGR
ncbi:MAG TPA: hypothetical protein VGR46_13930 [Candidatus Limnocylindria bacterium]|jgi:hypothetical protein|nr:hypothetical protein [Candidatus Limnocylindria bacterium]